MILKVYKIKEHRYKIYNLFLYLKDNKKTETNYNKN